MMPKSTKQVLNEWRHLAGLREQTTYTGTVQQGPAPSGQAAYTQAQLNNLNAQRQAAEIAQRAAQQSRGPTFTGKVGGATVPTAMGGGSVFAKGPPPSAENIPQTSATQQRSTTVPTAQPAAPAQPTAAQQVAQQRQAQLKAQQPVATTTPMQPAAAIAAGYNPARDSQAASVQAQKSQVQQDRVAAFNANRQAQIDRAKAQTAANQASRQAAAVSTQQAQQEYGSNLLKPDAARTAAGFVPVVGSVLDTYDAAKAAQQGRYGDAAKSAGLAALGVAPLVKPIAKAAGIGAKAISAAKAADAASDIAKAAKVADTATDVAKAGKAIDTATDVAKATDKSPGLIDTITGVFKGPTSIKHASDGYTNTAKAVNTGQTTTQASTAASRLSPNAAAAPVSAQSAAKVVSSGSAMKQGIKQADDLAAQTGKNVTKADDVAAASKLQKAKQVAGAQAAAGAIGAGIRGDTATTSGGKSSTDANTNVGKDDAKASAGSTYKVNKGDTLGHIAQRQGTTVANIIAANPGLVDAETGKLKSIRPDQTLNLGTPSASNTNVWKGYEFGKLGTGSGKEFTKAPVAAPATTSTAAPAPVPAPVTTSTAAPAPATTSTSVSAPVTTSTTTQSQPGPAVTSSSGEPVMTGSGVPLTSPNYNDPQVAAQYSVNEDDEEENETEALARITQLAGLGRKRR